MKPLTNAKHEAFAQALAAGKSQADAYSAAGFSHHRSNASKLAHTDNIQARLASILDEREKAHGQSIAKAIEKTALTKEWVIEQLQMNAARASTAEPVRDAQGNETGEYTYQGAVVNRALELLGKELGMFIDRKEVGKPGAFDKMTPEQKRERAISLAKQLGIDRVRPRFDS